jgi:hypothetical protein
MNMQENQQQMNSQEQVYFQVSYFTITRNGNIIFVNKNEKEQQSSIKYPLSIKEVVDGKIFYEYRTEPKEFFDYLRNLSKQVSGKLCVAYKFEYFNHDHINEYQNVLEVDNGFIIDGLLG